MSDDVIGLAWIGTCLILVVSALAARGLSGSAWIRMGAIWVAIIGGVWMAFLIAARFSTRYYFT